MQKSLWLFRYSEGEATNSANNFTYTMQNGGSLTIYYDESGKLFGNRDTLQVQSTGMLWYEYKKGLFLTYDKKNTRRDGAFLSAYLKDGSLLGLFLKKNMATKMEILHRMNWLFFMKKNKEFVNEGQRWWDVRRMTLTKGGKPLVFCKEGNIDSDEPILDETTEGYKVLWPVETEMLNKDPKVKQTPGYK